MKVQNPNPDHPIVANIFGRWYEVPAGESIETDDAAVAVSLVEYGANMDPVDLDAAFAVMAETNRGINSRYASASASEGEILGRQQRTVSVVDQTVAGGELKGKALDAAVAEANAHGANIGARLSAAEKRDALVEWQARQGSSSAPRSDDGEFLVDDAGNLILDSEGQPIPAGTEAYARDENGAIVFDEDGSPVAVEQEDQTSTNLDADLND